MGTWRKGGGAAALWRALLGAAALWIGAAASAAEGPDLDEARRLLEAGQTRQAAAMLEPGLLRYAGNPDYDYLLGQALYRAGDSGQARFAFERVLMMRPDHDDARLMLARVSVDKGEGSYAAEVLAPLAERSLDAERQRQVDQLRADIAAAGAGRLLWSGYLLAGYGWDSNVTGGPAAQSMLIPTLGLTQLDGASQFRDHTAVVEGGFSWAKPADADTLLAGNAALRIGDNLVLKAVNEGYLNLDAGLLRRLNNEVFGATLLMQNYTLANISYRRTLGTRFSWMHPLGETQRLTSYLQYSDFFFPDHSIDNAARTVVGASDEIALGEGRVLQLGAYAGDERNKDPTKPHFSFRILGYQLGGSLRLSSDLALSAGIAYELRNHKVSDALFLVVRDDRQFNAGLAADIRLAPRWHLLPQYVYVKNASTTPLYAYSRNAVMLHLRWDFDNDAN